MWFSSRLNQEKGEVNLPVIINTHKYIPCFVIRKIFQLLNQMEKHLTVTVIAQMNKSSFIWLEV